MKPLFFLAASALALSAAACAPHHAPRTALDCPAQQKGLMRISAAADGKSCLYRTKTGDEVQLRLLAAAPTPAATLTPIEQELQAEIAPAGSAPKAAVAAAKSGEDEDVTDQDDAVTKAENGKVGDHAQIDLPGLHINADDKGAKVDVGVIHVDAGDSGAVIRSEHDVRLKGEAFIPEQRGFMALYMVARDDLRDGWKAVGYQAGGPKQGPIAVAVVKTRKPQHDAIFSAAKRLVRLNGGV